MLYPIVPLANILITITDKKISELLILKK